jgi:hypothetical protein
MVTGAGDHRPAGGGVVHGAAVVCVSVAERLVEAAGDGHVDLVDDGRGLGEEVAGGVPAADVRLRQPGLLLGATNELARKVCCSALVECVAVNSERRVEHVSARHQTVSASSR